MKKIVFFLALFSFSMGCLAQQDYEREINELKSRYNSLVILVQKLEKENESKKAELEKKKNEWERECELCMKYAEYLSPEDSASLVAQINPAMDGDKLRNRLEPIKNEPEPTIEIKQIPEEDSTSTIIVEVGDINHSEEELDIDAKEGANSESKVPIDKPHSKDSSHSSKSSSKNNIGDITDGGKNKAE